MSNVSPRGPRPSFQEKMRRETMFPRWMHRLGYYALALLFVAAAAALRWALPEVLGSTPFLAFYLAWVGAAAFGGLGPGLLATVASWCCAQWLFGFTPGQTIFKDPAELGRFVVLMAGGLMVSVVAERMRRGRIRERERAEELATFLDAAPTPVIIVHDANGVRMTGNRAADELLRHRRGAEISLSAPPETKPRHFKAVKDGRELRTDELPAQRAARGEQVRDFEFSLVFDDGATRHMLGYGTPLRDEDGQPRGAVHILVDITERKRAEEALRELNATLESKVAQRTAELEHRARQLQKLTLELSLSEDRERERLAEVLHDDLQQMLVAAKFHLSLLKNRVSQVPAQQAIAVKVDEMLQDAIAKSRSLSHELSPAVVHRNDLAETFAWLARQMQAKHGLTVRVDAHQEVRLQSEAIAIFLFRAAQEMLFNVIKHAGVDEARIRVRRRGRCICMSVSDRGRGFDTREQRETGGFGLFSIRERVELLGGRMKIKTAKGQSSTFSIVVPDGAEEGENARMGEDPGL